MPPAGGRADALGAWCVTVEPEDGAGGRLSKVGRTISRKLEPLPGSLSMSISPPWRCTTCLTMDKPSPVPPVSRERLLSTR
jgi:hypothetical protein